MNNMQGQATEERGAKVVTYEQAEAIHAREDAHVGSRREPDLHVEDSTARLGPLELFLTLADRTAQESASVLTLKQHRYLLINVVRSATYSNLSSRQARVCPCRRRWAKVCSSWVR